MNTTAAYESAVSAVLAVSNAALLGAVGAFVGGLIIAGALVWAVRLGIKVRRREQVPPKAREQPKLPDSGPVHETREMREPAEVPRAEDESERLVRQRGPWREVISSGQGNGVPPVAFRISAVMNPR